MTVPRAALVLALALAAGSAAAAEGCQPGEVALRGPAGQARFRVELAATEQDRERGLMDRRAMAADAGMLFVYDRPVHARFWMKDTLIPLDMIFVDPAGRVLRVAADARPMDETIIDGGPGVQFVLEINGGLAAQLGIAPGSQMQSPALDQGRALWPCTAP